MKHSITSATLRNLILAVTCMVVAACGGSSTGGTGSGITGKPGGQCSTEGAKVPAADGCNTCTCTNGSYACTEMACLAHDGGGGPPCTNEGATTIAADGCNVCSCRNGISVCSDIVCPDDAGSDAIKCSTPGATQPAADGCNTCTCSAKHQLVCSNRVCPECKQGDTMSDPWGCGECSCSPSGQWACPSYMDPNCAGPFECNPGQTKQQDCNTCSCLNGQWACTYLACNACTEGDRKAIDCNTCLCASGQWACTKKACLPPGLDAGVPIDAGPAPKFCGARAGDTCASNEYCAYAEGALCGAADAEATCAPRPTACDTIYSPVCGCDGKDYTNSCLAAVAGTGVRSSGACPTGAF